MTSSTRRSLSTQSILSPSVAQQVTSKPTQRIKSRIFSVKRRGYNRGTDNLCKCSSNQFCRVAAFEPATFGFETTNNTCYQDFKFKKPEKPSLIKPIVYAVTTKAPPTHFTSTTKSEMKFHQYRRPEVDNIPYP